MAVFSVNGELLFSRSAEADRRASMVLSGFLREVFETHAAPGFTGWVADVGPGSFTGTRVAVTMAKTLAWAAGVPVAGILAFDLISRTGPAIIPAKRGQVWMREPSQEPVLHEQEAAYAPSPPSAQLADVLALKWLRPEELVPMYMLEPRISTPKSTMGGARPT